MEKFLVFVILTNFLSFGECQLFGEETENKFPQIFESVDSDISEYYSGEYFDYEDLLPSESALSEKQIALRSFYKRRRPKFGKKGKGDTLNRIMDKIEEVNKRLKNKSAMEEGDIFTGSESERKVLQNNPSGPAVDILKPPPDFKLPENLDTANKVKTNSVTKNTNWSSNKKQRAAAAATSLIGSRLKDLKKKRKIHMNSDLVTDHDAEETVKRKLIEERSEQDLESMKEVKERFKSHSLKVPTKEKTPESSTHNKKRRFKPKRKPASRSPKSSLNRTSDKKLMITQPEVILEKSTMMQVREENDSDVAHAGIVKSDINEISEEIFDEVYGKLDSLYKKVEKLRKSEKGTKEEYPLIQKEKKTASNNEINAEESAQPLSIIPHGVPLRRGFPAAYSEEPKKQAVQKLSGFTADQIKELSNENENAKMSPNMINKNIEKVLKIKMPNHTKLLYGDKKHRFERNPEAAENLAKPYSFNYSILDEETGITHSRDESSDDRGVVRGSYQVLEPGCIIRRVEYQADDDRGFQVLSVTRTPCKDTKQENAVPSTESQELRQGKKSGSELVGGGENGDSLVDDNAKDRFFLDIGSLLGSSPSSSSGQIAQQVQGSNDDVVAPGEDYGIPAADPVTNYEASVPAVAPAEDYGVPAADPITNYEASVPAVAPAEDYGVPAADPVTNYEASVPAVAPAQDYGVPAADPVTNYEASVPGVAPSEGYGAPLADPLTNYEAPIPAVAVGPSDSYGVPAAKPISNFGDEDSISSPTSQFHAAPLPATGIKLNTPVRSFLPLGAGPQAKTVESDSYDPFAFQELGTEEIFGESDDPDKEGPNNANLQNINNNHQSNTAGQNDQPEATRNNEANNSNSIVLQGAFINHKPATGQNPSFDQPLVFGSFQNGNNNNNDVFNQLGVSAVTGAAAKSTTTRRPLTTQTEQSSTRRPTVAQTSFKQQFNQATTTQIKQEHVNPQRPAVFSQPVVLANHDQSNPSAVLTSTRAPKLETSFQGTRATRRTTARTSQRTTRGSVLIQQATLFDAMDDGLQGHSDLSGFESPTPNSQGRPEKLRIGLRPIKEITGASGIFFSTPSSSFVTPDDFATPVPRRRPSQQLRSQDSEESIRGSTKGRQKGQPFKANKIITTTSRPIQTQTTPSVSPRPVFVNSVTPQSTFVNSVTPQSKFVNSVTPLQSSSFNFSPAPKNQQQVFSTRTTSTRSPPTISKTRTSLQPKPVTQSLVLGFSPRPSSSQSRARTQSALTHLRQQLTDLKQSSPTLVNTEAVGATFSPHKPQQSKVSINELSRGNIVQTSQRLQTKNSLSTDPRKKAVKRKEKNSDNAFVRRNMLMNIILRPGGGDRAKALPRPKVEVNSEGSNVILVKLTFPENENIQGLRAFTPTDPKDLEKFAELRDSIASDASIERISAISSEEGEETDSLDRIHKLHRASKSKERFSKPVNQVVANPTRPPRPIKQQKAYFSHLQLRGSIKPFTKPLPSNTPLWKAQVKKSDSLDFTIPPRGPKSFATFDRNDEQSAEIINLLDKEIDREISEEFQFIQFNDSKENVRSSRIKPRQPQNPPPSGEVQAFTAYEAMDDKDDLIISNEIFSEPVISNNIETSHNQQSTIIKSGPTRPPRPAKPENKLFQSSQNQIKQIQKPRRPPGPPPRPRGPPPQLPPQGVQLTRSGRRHPGLRVQARLDTKNNYSFPKLDKVWRGRHIL